MATNVIRFTTQYDEAEDRIKIAGETKDGESVVIWLTNRLAVRAVPIMLRWLDGDAKSSTGVSPPGLSDVIQGFNQQAAVATLKPQKPVIPDAAAPAFLTHAMDVETSPSQITLIFRGKGDRSASLKMNSTRLRQWLSILHLAWTKAQWSPLLWPEWIKQETATQEQIVLH